jgi:hypothetical protein
VLALGDVREARSASRGCDSVCLRNDGERVQLLNDVAIVGSP